MFSIRRQTSTVECVVRNVYSAVLQSEVASLLRTAAEHRTACCSKHERKIKVHRQSVAEGIWNVPFLLHTRSNKNLGKENNIVEFSSKGKVFVLKFVVETPTLQCHLYHKPSSINIVQRKMVITTESRL